MSIKNPFLFGDIHPEGELADYSSDEAYEMGVSAGWDYVKSKFLEGVYYIPAVECRMNEKYVRLADVINMLEMKSSTAGGENDTPRV